MSDLARETEANKQQSARFLFQKDNQLDDDEIEKDLIQIEEEEDVELLSHDDYPEEDDDIDEEDLDDQMEKISRRQSVKKNNNCFQIEPTEHRKTSIGFGSGKKRAKRETNRYVLRIRAHPYALLLVQTELLQQEEPF